MGKGHTIEIKVACRRDYVENRLTLPQIEELRKVSRQTLSNWRSDGKWDAARESNDASPDQIGDRIKKEISDLLVEIDAIKKDGGALSDILLKRMDTLTKMLQRLDNTYYSKPMMLKWANAFVDFVANEKESKDILASLQKLMPRFIDYVERQS